MNIQNYLSLAIEAALKTGKNLESNFGNVKHFTKKDDEEEKGVNIVTKFDKEAEKDLAEILLKYDNNVGFHGEEFGEIKKGEKMWLVDPIDGTAHYVRGIPVCTTMISLVDQGEVVIAVIYDFLRHNLFSAIKNAGAFLNSKPIHVSKRSLKDAYICLESKLETEREKHIFFNLRKHAVIVTQATSGYEYALVAQGKLDGRISINPWTRIWDIAPGCLLVKEAGGIVKNFGKDSYTYTNMDVIATNPVIYKELTSAKIF